MAHWYETLHQGHRLPALIRFIHATFACPALHPELVDGKTKTVSVRRIPDEIVALHRIGLSPMQAIGAATSVSAELLGIAGRTGSIKVGMEADLILVDRDPLADISALHDVVAVINNGQIVVHQRER